MAGPGKGKTWTLRRIVQYFKQGGILFDPLHEFDDVAGVRWNVIHHPRIQTADEDDVAEIVSDLRELEPGACVIFNEGHRWLPNAIPLTANPILEYLDNARNYGVNVAIESKRPALLSAMVPDLVQAIAFKPFKFKRSKQWLVDAGVPDDIAPIVRERWYLMAESDEDIFDVEADHVARFFGDDFPLTGAHALIS